MFKLGEFGTNMATATAAIAIAAATATAATHCRKALANRKTAATATQFLQQCRHGWHMAFPV